MIYVSHIVNFAILYCQKLIDPKQVSVGPLLYRSHVKWGREKIQVIFVWLATEEDADDLQQLP
jgi:hypothetical protein